MNSGEIELEIYPIALLPKYLLTLTVQCPMSIDDMIYKFT